ncbi:RNA methyltransferase [Notoacmeibacter sp. MSK16QG-6]|uniref:TrmH family RNA methyltransferase n=1 Tax=Notoacmeibacter sp. MSK16QG-6 TaxID=2957982 RepID=UPI0020A0F0DB|nr:RNA methyltransferase [Notoacmeibacter sp. MSK16QG-6]MCP1198907.1 RNA methyltransferase [Notoacmeibacter sp. MSK16QG-6]
MNDPSKGPGRPGRVKEITALTNPTIKAIRGLDRKRNREANNSFMAEGQKLVIDAVDLGWTIKTLIYAKNARGHAGVADLAAKVIARGGDVLEVSEKVLGAITRRDNPQMVVGVFAMRWADPKTLPRDADTVCVVLDRVRDPGNLGTILRTADAAGAKGIILVGDCVDPFSIEAVRATMGSLFAVPIARMSEEEFLAFRTAWPGKLIGTHLEGAVDYRTVDWAGSGPLLLMMGNESHGLPDNLAQSCDLLARIPQSGRADSLNLAVATGLMLFEARRHALSFKESE